MRMGKTPVSWPVARLMRGDENSVEIKMCVDRFADGVDLGGLTWMLSIKNAAGETDVRQLEAHETEDKIELLWRPAGIATKEPGETQIWISGFDGEEKIWNTERYKIEIADREETTTPDNSKNELTELQQLILYVDKELDGVVAAGKAAAEAAKHPPIIGDNGNWLIWSAEKGGYEDSGKPSVGGGNGTGGGIVKETDPTVPDWAKQPKKPTYTAEEVDALPANTPIPAPYVLPADTAETLGGVKVGDGLTIADGVLWVKPEGVYELIETITVDEDMVVERTQEPDGTPYNFTSFAIRVKKPANYGTTSYINAYVFFEKKNNAQLYVQEHKIDNTSDNYFVAEVYRKLGYYVASRYAWSLITGSTSGLEAKALSFEKRVSDCGNIIRFNTLAKLPAGFELQLWGVRA